MISVVMPVYNHVHFVREAIDSILNQTYKNFELILVDDGSTDGSSDILKEYVNKDKRIRYFYKSNGGTGSALNLGFFHATGKYGTWVSSDNIYCPKMLETLRNFLVGHSKSQFVFSSFSFTNGVRYSLPRLKQEVCILADFLDRSFEICVTGICYLFEMSLKCECGEYILIPGEDYVMGVKMGLKTNVGYVSESLGVWRNHPNTITQQLRDGKYNGNFVCPSTGRTANQIAIDLIKESRGG